MIDGKPEWVAEGTWEQTHRTGNLENVQLRDARAAKPISETEYVMDWEGTLTEGSKQ
jgi:hypothetical protein